MVVEGLSCSCSCLAMWFLNPVLEVAESCSCSCWTHRYCRIRGIGCWNRVWSSSLFQERYYPRAQVVPHPPSFRLQGTVRVIDPCWTQCSGAVPCNGNGCSSSASEAVQSLQRDATLHEMTTNSTKFYKSRNRDMLSHCWRPSSYIPNQIKFACWF